MRNVNKMRNYNLSMTYSIFVLYHKTYHVIHVYGQNKQNIALSFWSIFDNSNVSIISKKEFVSSKILVHFATYIIYFLYGVIFIYTWQNDAMQKETGLKIKNL